jgi:hypothetical protein
VPYRSIFSFSLLSCTATSSQVWKSRKEILVKQVRFYEAASVGARKSSLVLQKEVPLTVWMTAVPWGEVICYQPSPAELFLVSRPVVTRDQILICSKTSVCFEMGSPLWRRSNLLPSSHCYIPLHPHVTYVNKRTL